MNRPLSQSHPPSGLGPAPESRFQRDVAMMLLTFFTVALIDVVVISLVTHRLRFWFPLWLDPEWETRPDPWVVYSQSYAAGIFMVPLMWRAIDREWLGRSAASIRAAYWLLGAAVFSFLLWWKGGLMAEHKKGIEAIGWAALTAIVWTALHIAAALRERLANLTRQEMLAGLVTGVAAFFLVMSLLDPLLQLGVQHLAWTRGLVIEVGFFIPAGTLLLWFSRRLRRQAAGDGAAPIAGARGEA